MGLNILDPSDPPETYRVEDCSQVRAIKNQAFKNAASINSEIVIDRPGVVLENRNRLKAAKSEYAALNVICAA